MTTITARKTQLQARRDALSARLAAIEGEFDAHESRDWEEMATEREGDEVLEGMGHSARTELRMIEAALHRIEDGDYGICARCGAPIGDARLDVLPYTPFCSRCAA